MGERPGAILLSAQCLCFALPFLDMEHFNPAGEAHCASLPVSSALSPTGPYCSSSHSRMEGWDEESGDRQLLFLSWVEAHTVLRCGLGAMGKVLDASQASCVGASQNKGVIGLQMQRINTFSGAFDVRTLEASSKKPGKM